MNRILAAPVVATLSSLALAQTPCTLAENGTLLVGPPIDNFTMSPVPLGFTFTFNGTSYDEIFVSDHGILTFANGGVPVPNGGAATYTPGAANLDALGADCVFAYWGDHSTQGFGTPTSPNAGIWIDNTSGTHCTVTWVDNEPYLGFTAGAFSNSVTLFSSGEIRVRMDSRCNNTSSTFGAVETVVGVHTLNNPIPASSDLSQPSTVAIDLTVFEEFIGPGPAGSNSPDPNFDLGDTTLTFTPLGNGWLVTPSTLDCGSATDAGGGCGSMTLTTTATPFVGTRWDVELTGVQPSILPVFLTLGASVPQTPVGVLLPTLFGASCVATQDATSAVLAMPAATAGTTALSLPIPMNPTLAGLTLSAQGLAFDLASAAEFELSNGNDVVVGY
ncbi:MAG: hypothetical protein ACON4Z_02195 [Planctomycetota bacterium]